MHTSDLLKIYTFGISNLTKIIIINENKDIILTIFWVLATSFEDFNNKPKLLIVYLVPNLS